MADGSAVQQEVCTLGREPRPAIPHVYPGSARLHEAALAPGALDGRTKQLIALAIAVTRECDSSITTHARGAARSGANEAEIAEALGVAMMMNGDPDTVYGPRALTAFRAFGDRPAGPPAFDGLVIVG